jgi:2-C-methyl-D-erythritol 4-phosphate cytidylyltransferase
MSATRGPAAVGVILAAGMGTRVGADGNKAYLPLAGRAMVAWSVDAVARSADVDRTVLVFRRGERDLARTMLDLEFPSAAIELVEGGDTRHQSEFNVLRYLSADITAGRVDAVLIHDAARPLAGPELMGAALSAAREFGGAIPALRATDVVITGADGRLSPVGAVLMRVQTPQAFRALPLLEAYLAAAAEAFEGTDTSSCIERFTDVDVRVIPGAATNLKVTYSHDLAVAERLLRDGVSPPGHQR